MADSQAVVTDEALKKLEDQLTCAICFDSFKQPKMLDCFHVFCEHCLQGLVVQDGQRNVVRCPTCRHRTILENDVSGLKSAFYIHHFFEIQDILEKTKEPKKVQCEKCIKVSRPATSFCRNCGKFICASCVDIHTNWEELSSHEIVSVDQLQGAVTKHVPPKKVTHFCLKHDDQQLRLYCETCEELICHDCTVQFHKGHQYEVIRDTFERHKTEITASIKPVKVHKSIVNDKLIGLKERHTEIINRRDKIETDIHSKFLSFIEILKGREEELISQLDELVQLKVKNLEAQRDEVEIILVRLDRCLSVVAETLKTGNREEVMKMKKAFMKQIETMTAEFNEEALTPCEEANMVFVTSPGFADDCGRMGNVLSEASPDPRYATGKVGVVNEKALAVDEKLDSDMHEVADKNSVMLIKNSQHKIPYHPTSVGRRQCLTKHIKAVPPYAVAPKSPTKTPGITINNIIKGLNSPWGVAVNKRGEIIVVENTANCVSIFSRAGERIRSFGSKGRGIGQFNRPRGVAVDDDGHILVTDSENDRIQKFTEDGNFITSVGSKGEHQLQFNTPTGIAIHPINKHIYVTESLNHRVQILNPDLTPHSMFGSKGSDKGQFNQPRGMAFDSAGNVYIGEDRSQTRIQVFSAKGDHLRWLGHNTLNSPHDITIDSNDTIYVCDTDKHRIRIFNANGKRIRSRGSQGTHLGQFKYPYGIATDKSGMIYVSDRDNGCVHIFELL